MRKYIAILLAGLMALGGCKSISDKYRQQKNVGCRIEVPVGKVGYSSKNELFSKDYNACSALILSGDKGATLAHVFATSGVEDLLDSENAVKSSLDLMIEKGNLRKNIQAALIAGNQNHYDKILHDLKECKITIRKAELADNNKKATHCGNRFWAGARDITYFPVKAELSVKEKTIEWNN